MDQSGAHAMPLLRGEMGRCPLDGSPTRFSSLAAATQDPAVWPSMKDAARRAIASGLPGDLEFHWCRCGWSGVVLGDAA